jgi:hypothetical protein
VFERSAWVGFELSKCNNMHGAKVKIMYLDLPVKYQLFISEWNLNFLNQFLRHTQISWKSVQLEPNCFMQMNGQTDMTMLCNFANAPKNMAQNLPFSNTSVLKCYTQFSFLSDFIVSDYISYSSLLRHQTIIKNHEWKFYLRLNICLRFLLFDWPSAGQGLATVNIPGPG